MVAFDVLALEVLPESMLRSVVDVMVRLVEACGAVVIATGALVAIVRFALVLVRRDVVEFSSVRLTLGRFLALGLEFQLAADVLRTAISPSFEEIGKLAAIAAIRTALNYFLAKEIAQEQAAVASEREAERQRTSTPPPDGSPP